MPRSRTWYLGVLDQEAAMTTAQMLLITLEVVFVLVGVALVVFIVIRNWKGMRGARVLRVAEAFELCLDWKQMHAARAQQITRAFEECFERSDDRSDLVAIEVMNMTGENLNHVLAIYDKIRSRQMRRLHH
jgi:hypothetical protein